MSTETNVCRFCLITEVKLNERCKVCTDNHNQASRSHENVLGTVCECCSQITYPLNKSIFKGTFYGTLCQQCAVGATRMVYDIDNLYRLAEFTNPMNTREFVDSLKTTTPSRPDYAPRGVGHPCRLEGCDVTVTKNYARGYCIEHKKILRKVTKYNETIYEKLSCCECCESPNNLFIDHCHDSDEIRGTLCGPCNAAAGNFETDPVIFANMIRFLEEKNVPQ